MKKGEILKSLCYYDKRNPDNCLGISDGGERVSVDPCYCDNCFRGKTVLAEGYLRLYESAEVFLIGVKRGDMLIYPESDNTPNYIGILESYLK